jgi:hypothetical protein
MDNKEEKEEKENELENNERQAAIYYRDFLISALIGIPNYQELSNSPIFNENIFDNDLLMNVSNIIEENQNKEMKEKSEKVRSASEMDEEDYQKSKKPNITKIVVRKKITLYKVLHLKSGKMYYFDDDDGKDILVNERIEPNLFIRKLLSRIPESIQGRLEYLGEFMNEEMNEVIKVDEIETNEYIEPHRQFNPKKIFTNLKEQLFNAYLKEIRLRRVFRNVLQRWRIRRIDKKYTKDIDPITLMEPEKEIFLYDLGMNKKYTFDAKSLSNWIETKLSYSEGGFPVPMYPTNPWTNTDFTYYQLISIYNQLKETGEIRWGLVTLRKFNFNKALWARYHHSALTLSAIRNSLKKLDCYDSREIFEDFIYSKMDELHIYSPNYITNAYHQAILKVPNHWYLEELKAVAFIHYEADHFRHNIDRTINERCTRIFRKQNQFIEELIKLKVIQPRSWTAVIAEQP